MTVEERLEKIEAMLAVLTERQRVQEWYSVEEFARTVGRSAYTVREWCRRGRLQATKKESGRGAHTFWAISNAELLRFQHEGLRRRTKGSAPITPADGIAGLNDTSSDHEQP